MMPATKMTTAGTLRAEFDSSRRKNLDALQSLLAKDFPHVVEDERSAAAISLRGMLSGGNWTYLRRSCGLSQQEIVRSVQWSIRLALEHLPGSRGPSEKRRTGARYASLR